MATKTQTSKGKVGRKRTDEQKESDRAIIADLFLQGYTYRAIAEKLNEHLKKKKAGYTISFQQVAVDCKYIMDQWKSEQFTRMDQYVTAEVEKLSKIESEAWNAWQKTNESGKPNAKFLDVVLNVQQRRAKLMGYDAPEKLDVSGLSVNANTYVDYDVSGISDEQLFAIADRIQENEFNKQNELKNGKKEN